MSASTAALVIVPALGGSRAMLEPFLRKLPSWLHPWVVEPPGFGDARAPRGLPSTRRLARAALSAWPVQVEPHRTFLFGISLGGMVAQWLALDASRRMSGLVLASTTRRSLGALASIGEALDLASSMAEPGAQAHASLVEEVIDSHSAGRRARAAARAHPRGKADLLWLAAAAAAHTAPVQDIRVPAAVLTGGADPLIRPEAQVELAEDMHARMHRVLEGCGHDLTLDAPADCARGIAEAVQVLGARQ